MIVEDMAGVGERFSKGAGFVCSKRPVVYSEEEARDICAEASWLKREGKTHQAVKVLEPLVAPAGALRRDLVANNIYAGCLVDLKFFSDALAHMDDLEKEDPTAVADIHIQTTRINALLGEKKRDEALRQVDSLFSSDLELSHRDAACLHALHAKGMLGFECSEKAGQVEARLWPLVGPGGSFEGDAVLQAAYIESLFQSDRGDEALSYSDYLIHREKGKFSENEMIQNVRAKAFATMGEHDDAFNTLAFFVKAKPRARSNVMIQNTFLDIFDARDKTDDAIEHIETLFKEAPELWVEKKLQRRYVSLLFRAGDDKKAFAHMDEAFEDPRLNKDVGLHDVYASNRMRDGRPDLAREHLWPLVNPEGGKLRFKAVLQISYAKAWGQSGRPDLGARHLEPFANLETGMLKSNFFIQTAYANAKVEAGDSGFAVVHICRFFHTLGHEKEPKSAPLHGVLAKALDVSGFTHEAVEYLKPRVDPTTGAFADSVDLQRTYLTLLDKQGAFNLKKSHEESLKESIRDQLWTKAKPSERENSPRRDISFFRCMKGMESGASLGGC